MRRGEKHGIGSSGEEPWSRSEASMRDTPHPPAMGRGSDREGDHAAPGSAEGANIGERPVAGPATGSPRAWMREQVARAEVGRQGGEADGSPRVLADAVEPMNPPGGLLRVHRSLIDHPKLDALSRRAVQFAGFLLPHLPDDLLHDIVAAWDDGHRLPIAAATAQLAWQNERLLHPGDALDAFVACCCELACRGDTRGPRLVRYVAASAFGMSGAEQDAVGEEFAYAAVESIPRAPGARG